MVAKSVCSVVCVFASAASAQPSFETIGYLPGTFQISHAFDVSADGSAVVGYSTRNGSSDAFRWTSQSGMVALPTLPGSGNYTATKVSSNGRYAIGSFATSSSTPGDFVWSEVDGMVAIGSLPGGRDDSTLATVGNNGMVLGSSSIGFTSTGASLNRAVRWTASGGLEALPLPDAGDIEFQSVAISTIDDGRIFGRSASGAWLYSDDTGFEMLDVPDGMNRLNSRGTFLTGRTFNPLNNESTPSYWTAKTGEVHLPLLSPTDFGQLAGASDDGSVIVGELVSTKVVWIDQGNPIQIKDYAISLGLDMDGWNITRIGGVSADGSTIVGTAYHDDWFSSGEPVVRLEAFVMTIPAPGAPGAAVVLGCVGLLVVRCRR